MWWNREIFGQELYNVVLWFLLYSMLGWLAESIYMSICNRKLTNRGFAKGPFCPIYGIGALTVYFALNSYAKNKLLLFLLGAILATVVELVTAFIMQKIFGEVWWDYHKKPFNYKGILCLESTIAWGFYTLALFLVLQNVVVDIVNFIPMKIGRIGGTILLLLFGLDFCNSLWKEKRDDIRRLKEYLRERF
jgi:Predicted membrane protein